MLNRIRQARADLTEAERRVADWVLENPDSAVETTLALLAAAAGTSEPTVVRFCRVMGCSGFTDFKLKLARSLAAASTYVRSDIRPDDQAPEIIAKVTDQTISGLLRTRDNLSPQSVESSVLMLRRARQVLFCGVGASGVVALDAQHKFFRLGLLCTAHRDIPTIIQASAILGPRDCLVAVSNQGRSKSLLEAVGLAHRNGASTIAVTAASSPLAQAAEIALTVEVQEDAQTDTPMNSRLAHLMVLDVVQVRLALSLGAGAAQRLRTTKEVLQARSSF